MMGKTSFQIRVFMEKQLSKTYELLQKIRRKVRPVLLIAFLFSLPINVLMLTVPLYMMQLFDRVLGSSSLDTLLFLTLIAVICLATMTFLEAVRGRILMRTALWIDQQLSLPIFIRSLEVALIGKEYKLETLREVSAFRNVFSGTGLPALFDLPWVIIYLAVIYLLHPILGHIALGGAIWLVFLAIINELMTQRRIQMSGSLTLQSHAKAEGIIRNANVVDAMGLMRHVGQNWDQGLEESRSYWRKSAEIGGIFTALTKFSRLSLQIIMLATGAWLTVNGEITGGAMLAGSIIVGRGLAPLEQVVSSWKQIAAAISAWRKIKALLSGRELRLEGMQLPEPEGHLVVEKATIRLPYMKKPILQNVSFDLHPGEMLGIVGPSAIGKTSLVRTLVGSLPPIGGSVRLDGAELFNWDHDHLGPHLGFLPQGIELFKGTIAQNIARMEEHPDADKVVEAAKLAGIHEMILTFPDGYDSPVGEAGEGLSGGQKQRIALARALYGQPKLLVLDEPNANLDEQGELQLRRALHLLKAQGTTIIIVGHRRGGMQDIDKLLVLKEGGVDLYGAKKEVLAVLAERMLDASKKTERHVPDTLEEEQA